jgi:hypothetical protein
MNTPGFTAEISLIRSNIRHSEAIKSVDGRIAHSVVPAESAAHCRHLLEMCVSQPDPQHPACNFWLMLC